MSAPAIRPAGRAAPSGSPPADWRSKNALNFAYIVYLKLRAENYHQGEIEGAVRKWLVLSLLTGRYSGSPESMFDLDIRNISKKKFLRYLSDIEAAELSDAFWDAGLVQQLNTATANSPAFNVYLAALCKSNNKGFLSKDILVRELIEHKGDIHHVFPKDYLKKAGFTKSAYNQVANYVYMQTEINVQVGNKAPNVYMGEVAAQCNGGTRKYGSLCDLTALKDNLAHSDIPGEIFEYDHRPLSRVSRNETYSHGESNKSLLQDIMTAPTHTTAVCVMPRMPRDKGKE